VQDGDDTTEHEQPHPGFARVAETFAGGEAELDHENAESPFEGSGEKRLHVGEFPRTTGPSDEKPAQQQHDALAGDDFVEGLFPAPFRPAPSTGEEQGDDDAGHLQHGDQGGQVSLGLRPGAFHRLDRGEEGDDRDRTVMRGDRGGVLPAESPEAAHQEKGRDRRDQTEQHGREGGHEHLDDRGDGQGGTALEPDREEEINRKTLVDRFRDGEIALHPTGRDPQGKTKDDRGNEVVGERVQRRGLEPARNGAPGGR
jgi:hypothetical protein